MTEFLDELARSMAKPLPRRRALYVVATATVGAWLQSSGSLARAGPRRAQHICDTRVSKEGWKYCTPASEACFPTCCPKAWGCCKGQCGSNGCCEMFCCNPCNPKSSRCVGAGVCGRGPVRPDCCNGEVRPGKTTCGETCCDPWEKCASPRRSFCCKTKETPCLTKTTATCCSPGETCCGGKDARACCTPNQICRGGNCECRPGTRRTCGGDCCHPTRDKCCPGARPGTKHCIRKTRVCCGASSCPPGATCCSQSRETCARAGQRCCGPAPYDPAARKCCGGDYLCGTDDTCCNGGCCGPDEDCTPQGCRPAQLTSRKVLIERSTGLLR
jgi:hypothetical protein